MWIIHGRNLSIDRRSDAVTNLRYHSCAAARGQLFQSAEHTLHISIKAVAETGDPASGEEMLTPEPGRRNQPATLITILR
jgi:hypothetical protein